MELVKELPQVLANITQLELVRSTRSPRHWNAYQSLIKRGTCFLPYPTSLGLAFAPSRFIGYVGNSFAKHAANKKRDGKETNLALRVVLGCKPVENDALEKAYRLFCKKLDVEISKTGTFGAPRKYWITQDVFDRLDLLAEEDVMADPSLTSTEKEQIIRARIGQGAFRDKLLAKWKRCCMTGCKIRPVLRASHIKPWRHARNNERLDVYNGLLLTANMDALFDRGLISFTDDGELLRKPEISEDDLVALGYRRGTRIDVTSRHATYLGDHRNRWGFKQNSS